MAFSGVFHFEIDQEKKSSFVVANSTRCVTLKRARQVYDIRILRIWIKYFDCEENLFRDEVRPCKYQNAQKEISHVLISTEAKACVSITAEAVIWVKMTRSFSNRILYDGLVWSQLQAIEKMIDCVVADY